MITMEGKGSAGAGDGGIAAGPPQRAPATLAECTDNADVMAYLCKKYDATYVRRRVAPTHVRMTLLTKAGDAWSGNGITTTAAVEDLCQKLKEVK